MEIFDQFLANNLSIGRYTYFGANCEMANCEIGSFCSIASGVKIGGGFHPTTEFISTYPAFYAKNNTGCKVSFVHEQKFIETAKTYIGHDVWIGTNSIILDGIVVGNGAIIGAGAVVTKDIPPYAIVGGVPAKVIKYRFSEEKIKLLEKFAWWNKDIMWIIENSKFFNTETFFDRMENDYFIASDKECSENNIKKRIQINNKEERIDFAQKFGKLYEQIQNLINSHELYIIYGYGTIGKTLYSFLSEQIIAFVDKTSNLISIEIIKGEVYNQKNLSNMKYDKIIISVLGREDEIEKYLIEEIGVKEEKIIRLLLN